MSAFDVGRFLEQLHAAKDRLSIKLIGDLTLDQADPVLMDYRDRFRGAGLPLRSDQEASRKHQVTRHPGGLHHHYARA